MRYMPPEGTGGLLPQVSLADLAEIIFRRRWSSLGIILATILATMVWVILIRGDSYVAEARLIVRLGQEQAPSPTTIADRQMMVGAAGNYGSNELEMLRSRDLIERLVDRVDLTEKPRPPVATLFGRIKDWGKQLWRDTREVIDDALIWAGIKPRLTPREQAIETISRALAVESPPMSSLVVARMVWSERGAPELLLQTLLELYFAHRSSIYQGATAATFFRERRQETGQRLAEAETALAAFEREHGISNPDEQRTALLKRLAEADAAVDFARVELEQAEVSQRQFTGAREAGEQELAMFAVSNFGTALQQTLTGQLAQAAARWLSAQSALSAQDQSVRRLRAEITAISGMLAQQLQATVDQRRDALRLREELRDNIRDELRALQAAMVRWQDLRRAVSSSARAYEFNDNKLNEAQGIAALEQARIGNVVVVQQPSEQAIPMGVRKSVMLMLAAAAGVLLAAIWITIREFFDHRLHNAADIDRLLGLRALGSVPAARKVFERGGSPPHEVQEALKRCALAIARVLPASTGQAVVVTGGALREGVSTMIAHLGGHLVRLLGLRVLLLDMGGGLTDRADRMGDRPTRITLDLSRPDRGLASDSPAWALATLPEAGPVTMIEPVIEAAKAAYDIVLIDTQPIQESVNTTFALRGSGLALIVCSANRLPYETLRQLANDLTGERVELVGCVLNRHRRQLPAWLEAALR